MDTGFAAAEIDTSRPPLHSPEPVPTTFRTSDGQPADLFDLRHYPVRASCRVCGGEIEARSFLRPFKHVEEGPAANELLSHGDCNLNGVNPDKQETP